MTSGTPTQELLQNWHQGDPAALDELLRRHLPWIRRRVSERLGPVLRSKAETQDFVQEALLQVLRYGPRFLLGSDAGFRKLVARIIENMLRDQHDWYSAHRRAVSRERPLPASSVLCLDGPVQRVTPPRELAQRHEWQAQVRLALELLSPDERRVLLWREWEHRSFGEIGAALGLTEDAARMRCNRALLRLSAMVEQLRRQDLDAALALAEEGDGR